MGRRGPGRKPTNLAVLHGDRADRVNTEAPQPAPAAQVTPPGWLDEPALAVWQRLAPDLTAKRVLTAWDVDAFAVLCDAVARHAEAAELVGEAGVLVLGDKDRLVKNPAAQLVRDYAAMITTYASRFGLTPSDRAQLKTGGAKSGGVADDLLS